MNVQETKEIRELTTAEVDEVTGGSIIVNAIRTAWTHALSVGLMMNPDTCAENFSNDLNNALTGGVCEK